jgi:hypothetical protein
MATNVGLPPGFVLDTSGPQASAAPATLPPGFELDPDVYDEARPGAAARAVGSLLNALPGVDYSKAAKGTEVVLAGAGKAFKDLGRGAGQLVGMVPQDDIQESERLDAPLMATGAGKAGNIMGNVAALAPTAFIPGANTYTGAALVGAGAGLLQPVAEGDVLAGKTKNAAIGAGLGVAGQATGEAIASGIGKAVQTRAANQMTREAQNAVRDTTLKAAKEAGYVIPPTQAKPSMINRALEGIAGKINTAQGASLKNQEITNRLVRKAIGLADDAPITPEALGILRQQAGDAYEAIRGAGTLQADAQYADDLAKIVQKYQGASKDFPELAKTELSDAVESINKQQFDADSALDAISILRERADKAFRGGDKAAGKAYRGMADSMEGVMERNLEAAGEPAKALLTDFREARKLIAKTYSIENALNPATGNVVASKLGNQLAKGKPLSGELKTVAQVSKAFPRATQEVLSSMPGMSPLDFYAGASGAAIAQNPSIAATMFGRPVARSLILSGPYQAAMTRPNYGTNALLELLDTAVSQPGVSALARLLPPSVYAAQQ